MWTPKRIKEYRLKLGMTQAGYAEALGVTRTYVNLLEKGVKTPSPILMKLLDCMSRETKRKEKEK